MSNRLFQGVIHQMKNAIDRTIGIIDESGTIISCSELGRIGEVNSIAAATTFMDSDVCIVNGCTYKTFGNQVHPEYAVFVDGDDELAEKYVNISAVALSNLKQYFDEKYDTLKGYRKLKIPASGQLLADDDIKELQLKID